MQLEDVLKDVLADVADHIGDGKVANYIPALAKIDPKKAVALLIRDENGTRFVTFRPEGD